jgi:hypothetical protein
MKYFTIIRKVVRQYGWFIAGVITITAVAVIDADTTTDTFVPALVITTPDDTREYDYGETIKVAVDVYDHGHKTINNNILWYMEPEEGNIIPLGQGGTIIIEKPLSAGKHQIKVIYKNSAGKNGEDLINVTINPPKRVKELTSGQAFA